MRLTVCDVCKDRNKEAKRHTFFLERKMDAAGSMDNEYSDPVDLCNECKMKIYAKALMKVFPNESERDPLLYDIVKEMIKR